MSNYFNKLIFKTTHSSYSGGTRRSIITQLNSKVRCLEYDIHNYDEEIYLDFKLGHNRPEEDVSYDEDNPQSVLLGDWLDLLMFWSKHNPKHEPISLCLDIKEKLVDSFSINNLKILNSTIHKKLDGKLYTHKEHIKRNNDSLSGTQWPTVNDLSGRIIVFLTGDHFTKWVYWYQLPLRDQFCFIAYSYEDDGGKEYSMRMLNEAKIVNCHIAYSAWAKEQFQKDKIVRIWGYNAYNNTCKIYSPPNFNPQGIICNFPATDTPYEEWYNTAFAYFC